MYKYKVVAKSWKTGGTVAKSSFNSVTIHHSAVQAGVRGYSAELRAKSYAQSHRNRGYPGISYHFFIPMDDSDNIYVTNYVNGHTWHNGNAQGNRKSLAILVDGNFDVEKPTEKQLLKLKQILDHIYANWFSKNGWFPFEVHMNTRDRVRHKYTEGKTVRTLHYHNEVAQRGYSTACCGKNLIPKVVEYRNKAGKVNWGNPQKDTMEDKIEAKNKIIEKQQDEINAKNRLIQSQKDEIEGLQEEIQSLKETVKKKEEELVAESTRMVDLLNRNSELLRRVADLETELDIQKVEPASFQLTWENLPTWVKYIAPNMLAAFIPGLITLIADLDIQEPEVLASLGISVATIKSLIIGYLKKIQKNGQNKGHP